MPRLQVKSFTAPDQLREFPLVRIETIDLDEVHVGHCLFEPGWRWSTSFGEMMGTASCPIRHLGYTISGSLRVVMDDGQGMDLAPGSVFDIPPGHDKWVVGDEPWVTVEWGGSDRAMGQAMQEPSDRQLATVLFTDIVDSTRRAAELGDRRWHHLLDDHQEVVRRHLARFGGREVKTTGDGFLAAFDGPAKAIRAADAIRAGLAELGLEIRVGLHTGEVELFDDDIGGIAVHIAARVMAAAGAGEIVCSRTVKDLVAGAGYAFADRGTRTLKGVPDSWQLYAVELAGR
jgi:class 3 adenylate cyclase